MRIIFAGTPEFAEEALASLVRAGFTVPLVLTQPDRPAGRGLKLQPSPVKAFAVERRIPVAQPRSLRLDGKYPEDARLARAAIEAAQADAMVVAAYGLILPAWVLGIPPLGCLNIHASLLPRWRGAAPIHRAIEAGDASTGITIMQMDEGLDTGAALRAEAMPIRADDSTGLLQRRLASLGGQLIVEALFGVGEGTLEPVAQPRDGVTYAHKVDKSEAAIDWARPAVGIERRLRAFDPFPGCTAELQGEVVKCWRGTLQEGVGAPGTVLHVADDGILVACGSGALRLTELQRAGGKRQPARAFLQRAPVAVGATFAAPRTA